MKPYKKYGDIYQFTKRIRNCTTNGYYDENDDLREFWVNRISYIITNRLERDVDCLAGYCLMWHLSYVIEKRDILFNWKRVVLAMRLYTHGR